MLFLYTALIDDAEDQLRFEEIYYSYRKQMLLVAQRILHDSVEAEDAVQVALLGIAKQIKNIPTKNTNLLRAYVLTAAKNSALNMLPKKQQQDNLLNIEDVKLAGEVDLFEQVAISQDYELLYKAIKKIPSIYRDVLMLKYVQELSMKEIATILGRKVSTVHQQITRGKKLLVAQCRKEGMDFAEQESAI